MPFSLFFVGIQTNTGTFGYLCDAAPASGGVNRIYTYTMSGTYHTHKHTKIETETKAQMVASDLNKK